MSSGRFALSIIIAGTVMAHAAPLKAQWSVCNRSAHGTGNLFINSSHSLSMSTYSVGWPFAYAPHTTVDDSYHRGWEGLWYLDTTNHVIWWDGTSVAAGYDYLNFFGGDEVIDRRAHGALGQTFTAYLFDVIDHIDIRIDPSGLPGSRTTHLAYVDSCTPPGGALAAALSETTTFMHELGHGYGYAHFDGWLSSMNSAQNDLFSCELGTSSGAGVSMYVQPDAQLTQCHDLTYGIYNGVDLALSPSIQLPSCNLATNSCSQVPGSWATVPLAATSRTVTVQFTSMSNRDALGASGTIIEAWLSTDNFIGGGDVRVGRTFFGGGFFDQGEVRRQSMTFTFNPQIAMPLTGAIYRVLLRIDADNTAAETRESNNAINTAYWLTRL